MIVIKQFTETDEERFKYYNQDCNVTMEECVKTLVKIFQNLQRILNVDT